jgi:hypothetical protein
MREQAPQTIALLAMLAHPAVLATRAIPAIPVHPAVLAIRAIPAIPATSAHPAALAHPLKAVAALQAALAVLAAVLLLQTPEEWVVLTCQYGAAALHLIEFKQIARMRLM